MFCTLTYTAIHGQPRSICSVFAAQCSAQWNRNIMLVIVFFRYPLATSQGLWCHSLRGIAPASAEATSLFSRGFPPPHHRCGVTEGRQTTTGNDWRFHMNTSNTIPADSKNTSTPSTFRELAIKVTLGLLKFFAGGWVLGALNEFGLIHSDRCDRHNAEIRANSRQLWTRTVAAYHATRFWDIAKLAHSGREHAPASTIMPHAAGRQSGQRRTPRRGGQAKKASNDPDGGDGEPPRPPRSFSSSRQHSPHLHIDFTRPLTFAGGAR